MKKKFFIIFCAFLLSSVTIFAQSNSTVTLRDDVYELLDIAESRGLCSTLKIEKPYTQNYIVSKLEEIYKNLEKSDDYLSKTEAEVVKQYIDRFTTIETDIKKLQYITSSNIGNLPVRFGVQGLTIEGMCRPMLIRN